MSENRTYSTNSDDSVECDDVDFLEGEEEEERVEVDSSRVDSVKDDVESKTKVSNVSRFELSSSPPKSRADVDDEDDKVEDETIKESADPTSVNETPSEVEGDVDDDGDGDEDARMTATIGKEDGAMGSQYLEMSRGSISSSSSSSSLCSST